MPIIKQAVIEQIYSSLEMRPYRASDFEVQLPEKGATFVIITFRHNPNFTFTITEGMSGGISSALNGKTSPMTIEAPGDFKSKENRLHESFEECVRRISAWCANIHADIRARVPIINEFDELKKQFEEHINFHFDDAESKFSREEVNEISQKFSDVYEKLASLQDQFELTEDQLKAVKAELESIKSMAAEYPKGVWASITKSRFLSIVGSILKTQEARQLMAEGVKKMLGWSSPPSP